MYSLGERLLDDTLRSLLRPMMAVGVKDSERKWASGCQYQYWVKRARPMMAVVSI